MKKLTRYNLKFDQTIDYLKYQLEGGNSLATEILNNLDFKKGEFFALLPNNTDSNKIYLFQEGHILKSEFASREYEVIPTLQEELESLVHKVIESKNLICVFEDVLRSSKDKNLDSFNVNNSLKLHQDEVYYLMDAANLSNNSILKCIENANAIWYFLCVLTKGNRDLKQNFLTQAELKEFSINTQLIVIGAYDGEGYVFWEPLENCLG